MSELTDAQINALAASGAQLLRETGRGRLLGDAPKTDEWQGFKSSPKSSPENGSWQGGNSEWPKKDAIE